VYEEQEGILRVSYFWYSLRFKRFLYLCSQKRVSILPLAELGEEGFFLAMVKQ
jgi:hypothetical protein